MANYYLKSQVLSSGLVQVYRDISKSLFFNADVDYKKPFTKYTFADAQELKKNLFSMFPEEFRECIRINNSDLKRKLRLKKRIEAIILDFGYSYFLTLTFRDDLLENTTEETRRKYVRRFLKTISPNFVANIDYGTINGREHYHCVFLSETRLKSSNFDKKWPYGFIYLEKININNSKSSEKLSKYISKLTNHAIKETASLKRIIYSR